MSLGYLTTLGEEWLYGVISRQFSQYYHATHIAVGFGEANREWGYNGDYKDKGLIPASDPSLFPVTGGWQMSNTYPRYAFTPTTAALTTALNVTTCPVVYLCTLDPNGSDYIPLMYQRIVPPPTLSGGAPYTIAQAAFVSGTTEPAIGFRFFNSTNQLLSSGLVNRFDGSGSTAMFTQETTPISNYFTPSGIWKLYLLNDHPLYTQYTHSNFAAALADPYQILGSCSVLAGSFTFDSATGEFYNSTTLTFTKAAGVSANAYPSGILFVLDDGNSFPSEMPRCYFSVPANCMTPIGNNPTINAGDLRVSLRGYYNRNYGVYSTQVKRW